MYKNDLSSSRGRSIIKKRLLAKKLVATDGCWLWAGSVDGNSYGRIMIDGVQTRVHRVSFQIFKPEEFDVHLEILHKCNTPRCFNPEHLYCGTKSENALDFVQTGRHWQSNKTHCKHGHEFTISNTIIRKDGGRECRECRVIANFFKRC